LEAVDSRELLSDMEYKQLLLCRFDAPLVGFGTGLRAPSISGLTELLGENWLGENLIDAVLDRLSLDLNQAIPDLIRILDCSFYTDLRHAYDTQRLSPYLIKLREEFLRDPPSLVAFIMNKDQCHWAPAVVVLPIHTVLQGDSAGFAFEQNLCDAVTWWLQDIVLEDGEWEERLLDVPLQQPGSGSCGLASISAIVSFAHCIEKTLTGNPPIPTSFALWTDERSHETRCSWIQSLLRIHLQAITIRTVSIAAYKSQVLQAEFYVVP
jgi:hypothetical protein